MNDPRMDTLEVQLTVNGRRSIVRHRPGELLVEVLRERLGLTGTHVGCMNGDCGVCSVEINGLALKSCMVLAAACDDADVTTIEGFAPDEHQLDPIQAAFWAEDGFQCGFCLPGQLFAVRELLDRQPDPSENEIRQALAGNLCRCTGYVKTVAAVKAAAKARRNLASA